jgi:putative lipoic acid-binding regulatory protein
MAKKHDAYKSLLDRLELYSDWPTVYRFKFIFKTEEPQIGVTVEGWFDKGVKKRYMQSSAKNYQSLTIDVEMEKAEDVIEIYKKGAEIEGLVML